MDVPFRYLSLTQSVQRDFFAGYEPKLLHMRAAVFQSSNLLIPNPLLSFLGFANSIPADGMEFTLVNLATPKELA